MFVIFFNYPQRLLENLLENLASLYLFYSPLFSRPLSLLVCFSFKLLNLFCLLTCLFVWFCLLSAALFVCCLLPCLLSLLAHFLYFVFSSVLCHQCCFFALFLGRSKFFLVQAIKFVCLVFCLLSNVFVLPQIVLYYVWPGHTTRMKILKIYIVPFIERNHFYCDTLSPCITCKTAGYFLSSVYSPYTILPQAWKTNANG